MYEDGIAELEMALALADSSAQDHSYLGYAYAVAGNERAAQAVLNALSDRAKEEYVPAMAFARVYMGLADGDRAFEWLERAYQERSGWISLARIDHLLDDLRSDARYRDFLGRINFREE